MFCKTGKGRTKEDKHSKREEEFKRERLQVTCKDLLFVPLFLGMTVFPAITRIFPLSSPIKANRKKHPVEFEPFGKTARDQNEFCVADFSNILKWQYVSMDCLQGMKLKVVIRLRGILTDYMLDIDPNRNEKIYLRRFRWEAQTQTPGIHQGCYISDLVTPSRCNMIVPGNHYLNYPREIEGIVQQSGSMNKKDTKLFDGIPINPVSQPATQMDATCHATTVIPFYEVPISGPNNDEVLVTLIDNAHISEHFKEVIRSGVFDGHSFKGVDHRTKANHPEQEEVYIRIVEGETVHKTSKPFQDAQTQTDDVTVRDFHPWIAVKMPYVRNQLSLKIDVQIKGIGSGQLEYTPMTYQWESDIHYLVVDNTFKATGEIVLIQDELLKIGNARVNPSWKIWELPNNNPMQLPQKNWIMRTFNASINQIGVNKVNYSYELRNCNSSNSQFLKLSNLPYHYSVQSHELHVWQ